MIYFGDKHVRRVYFKDQILTDIYYKDTLVYHYEKIPADEMAKRSIAYWKLDFNFHIPAKQPTRSYNAGGCSKIQFLINGIWTNAVYDETNAGGVRVTYTEQDRIDKTREYDIDGNIYNDYLAGGMGPLEGELTYEQENYPLGKAQWKCLMPHYANNMWATGGVFMFPADAESGRVINPDGSKTTIGTRYGYLGTANNIYDKTNKVYRSIQRFEINLKNIVDDGNFITGCRVMNSSGFASNRDWFDSIEIYCSKNAPKSWDDASSEDYVKILDMRDIPQPAAADANKDYDKAGAVITLNKMAGSEELEIIPV